MSTVQAVKEVHGASKLGALFWAGLGSLCFYGAFWESGRGKVGAATILSTIAIICFISSQQMLYAKAPGTSE